MLQEEALQHYVYMLAYPEDMGGFVFYIGKGTGDRIDVHERKAKRSVKDHKCNVIHKIWRAGGQVVKTKIVFFVTHKEALLFEQALIMLMRPYGHLTNLTDGGEGALGRKLSEESLRKLIEMNRERMRSEEIRRKIGEANKGRPVSEEHRRKLSEAMKRRKLSEEHRRKIGKANKGYIRSEETRRKISETKKQQVAQKHAQGLPRKPLSEEHRRKISEAAKKRYAHKRAQAQLTPKSKEVLDMLKQQGRPLYPKELALLLGVRAGTMRDRLSDMRRRGEIKNTGEGYISLIPLDGNE